MGLIATTLIDIYQISLTSPAIRLFHWLCRLQFEFLTITILNHVFERCMLFWKPKLAAGDISLAVS